MGPETGFRRTLGLQRCSSPGLCPPLTPGPVLAQTKGAATWNSWAPLGLPSPTPSVSLSPAGTGLRHGALQAAAQPRAPAMPGLLLCPARTPAATLRAACARTPGAFQPRPAPCQPRRVVRRDSEAGLRLSGRRGASRCRRQAAPCRSRAVADVSKPPM